MAGLIFLWNGGATVPDISVTLPLSGRSDLALPLIGSSALNAALEGSSELTAIINTWRRQNMTWIAGDTKLLTVYAIYPTGGAVNITGTTINFWIATAPGGTPLITKTVSSGIVITSGTLGVMTITIDASDTASLDGRYYFEIEITDDGGDVYTPVTGKISILRDI